MNFPEFFRTISLAAMTAIALYVATKIEDITSSIAQLNTNVALLVSQVGNTQTELSDHEARLRIIERRP